MARPLLVIVTGRTGSGKTTLARRLATDVRLPLLHKDGVKESLYETLGAPNRAESRRLGRASLILLRFIAGELLDAGVSLVLEANFRAKDDGAPLRALIAEHAPLVGQVWLTSDPETLERRVVARAESGARHPGHSELAILDEIHSDLAGPDDGPLALPGSIVALDTTQFDELRYAATLAYVRMLLDGATTAHGSL